MLEILSNEDVREIHEASLEILARTGILIEHDEFLRVLEERGAFVDFERKVARMPRELVMEHLRKAPERFTEYGRTTEQNLTIEKGRVYARTGCGHVNIIDIRTGERRSAIRSDIESCATLVDALDNIHIGTTVLYPSDIRPDFQDIISFEIMLENTGKHILVPSTTVRNLEI